MDGGGENGLYRPMTGTIIFALGIVVFLALCGIVRMALETPDHTPRR